MLPPCVAAIHPSPGQQRADETAGTPYHTQPLPDLGRLPGKAARQVSRRAEDSISLADAPGLAVALHESLGDWSQEMALAKG
ncbi:MULTISPECIES: hypothetical protein [Pseudomonas]|uniref:Uncharacterized protein n=1 Tax=Pseudomonas lurida TaxID=244566 RepID=A0ABY9FP04_9PSED|nr:MULTISPECIES: hypothetical protein [Pseudomonas]WLG54816.1 hypothetical protein PSH77_19325 [Pseudomonas extremorientalis]WLH05052.1 hypothetical protein PSH67_19675 [Pseudomonas lurida]